MNINHTNLRKNYDLSTKPGLKLLEHTANLGSGRALTVGMIPNLRG